MQLSSENEMSKVIRYGEWQETYREVLVELDRDKLRERIVAAETAISDRLRAIAGSTDHYAERQAMEDALSLLRTLKRDPD